MRIIDWCSVVCSSDLGIAPDVRGVVLHPAGLREVLRQLLLRLAEAAAIAGEKNGAAAGGSLVDGENAAFGTHAGSAGLELQLFLFVAVPAAGRGRRRSATDRKSVAQGKSVSARVDLGGRGIIKK